MGRSTGARTLSSQRDQLPSAGDTVDAALAAAGDAGAFERLYRRHLPRIYTLALRMAGPEAAEELTQEIFIRAWEKLGTFQGKSAFGTWLFRLGVNVILSKRAALQRQRSRQLNGDDILVDVPARPVKVDAGMDLETAIQTLPAGAREVFLLHDAEGYKHEEIAGMLDITVGTSKSQLHRARMMLRTVLGGENRETRP
jgi:RNA polymerase sigma-70 factor (ECF subfamily)